MLTKNVLENDIQQILIEDMYADILIGDGRIFIAHCIQQRNINILRKKDDARGPPPAC